MSSQVCLNVVWYFICSNWVYGKCRSESVACICTPLMEKRRGFQVGLRDGGSLNNIGILKRKQRLRRWERLFVVSTNCSE